ncbi:CueP family metal-binding protein [Micromonospora lutea]|uniref:CueP family metal-binding protein n=1 Tax=Micromonospora lutea TaxID=419825 RepID=A0ABQ4IPB0_9ACTN|nr:CueP family metal-binding protein [Micromonospora lutea]GIJ19736.1 hypothetical protein Vlu01_03600 [Micromonospora lutea]
MKRLVATTAVSALLLTGCATGGDDQTADPTAAASSAASADTEALLDRHGLAGKNTTEIIDHLDRLAGDDRPADLKASVRSHELVLSGAGQELTLDIPDDRFYLSVAPYVNRTHDCFHHSLTTCKGELAGTDVQVEIVDDTTGTLLVDRTQTTFANGFVGFWLPRDIQGTLRVTHDGRTGTAKIATGQDAPTCLTTLKLS